MQKHQKNFDELYLRVNLNYPRLSNFMSTKQDELSAFLRYAFNLCFLPALLISGCQSRYHREGESLYKIHCEKCHMADGSGLAKLIPPLDSSKLKLSDPPKLICLIKMGLPVNAQTGQQMPPNSSLNDVEMTNLINFLGSKYDSNTQTVKVQEVKKIMSECQSD